MTREGKVTLFIMSVPNHKDQARVVQYVETVRQVQDITGKSPTLFLLTGGRPITNLSSNIKKLGDWYGLSLPSASRVRKDRGYVCGNESGGFSPSPPRHPPYAPLG